MKTLRAVLQIPVLLLTFYLGVMNAYSIVQYVQMTPRFGFDWHFVAYVAEGILEVALLVWFYRRLGTATHPCADGNAA